jgi:hypothetical protein
MKGDGDGLRNAYAILIITEIIRRSSAGYHKQPVVDMERPGILLQNFIIRRIMRGHETEDEKKNKENGRKTFVHK